MEEKYLLVQSLKEDLRQLVNNTEERTDREHLEEFKKILDLRRQIRELQS